MMGYFLQSVNDGSAKGKRTSYLLTRLAKEALEEMKEVPPQMVEFYFRRAAAIMYWSATGERVIGMPMPDDFQPPAELCNVGEGASPIHDALGEEYAAVLAAGQQEEMKALEAKVEAGE